VPNKAAFKPTREAPPSKGSERKTLHEFTKEEKDLNAFIGKPHKKSKKRHHEPVAATTAVEVKQPEVPGKIQISGVPTIQALAEKMNLKPSDLIKKAMMLGKMVTINQRLDEETVFLLAAEYNTEVEYVTITEDEDSLRVKVSEEDAQFQEPRGPVVTIMGHVDHGKTSLLDAIRHTNVTGGEFGGITQHIGAYEVTIKNKNIVFLDTPGHEAFTAMRARGAKVTDIVILVVSAIDGMMPQTIEAIHHSQAANVPIIVAINKIDLPDANPMRIKQQLSEHNLVPEDWGGKTIYTEVSAKKRIGIETLLEMILLQADIMELKANPKVSASGVVIEAKLDRGRGPVATVLLQEGTLHAGEPFVCGTTHGRVRAMLNDKGEQQEIAGPAKAVEILGFSAVPEAGDHFLVVQSEKIAREVAYKREMQKREEDLIARHHISLDDLSSKIATGEVKELPIIIKGDVQGSIEALTDSLIKLSTDKVKLSVIHSGVGAITESDVLLASASNAIIIGFHVRPEPNASELAKREGVDIRMYRIIYDTVNEVKAAMAGLLAPTLKEQVLGRAVVRQLFRLSKVGTIAGCFVQSGKIVRNSKVRLLRDNKVVFEGNLGSLKRFKEDTREVAEGYECGITIENYNNLQEGDIIEAYVMEEIAAVL
jgi:translation initiation factor IF-2